MRNIPVEIALRYARVKWEDTPRDRVQREWSLVSNVFLYGHDNKLSADLSWLEIEEAAGPAGDDVRVRLQWDVSF